MMDPIRGECLIHLATKKDDAQFVQFLIAQSNRSVLKDLDTKSRTMLHIMAEHSCLNVMKSILFKKSRSLSALDIDAKDMSKNTALGIAATYLNCEIIRSLLICGAGVDVLNGVDDLHIAKILALALENSILSADEVIEGREILGLAIHRSKLDHSELKYFEKAIFDEKMKLKFERKPDVPKTMIDPPSSSKAVDPVVSNSSKEKNKEKRKEAATTETTAADHKKSPSLSSSFPGSNPIESFESKYSAAPSLVLGSFEFKTNISTSRVEKGAHKTEVSCNAFAYPRRPSWMAL
jgi:hypothetical protein